jgi:hypothetical protein
MRMLDALTRCKAFTRPDKTINSTETEKKLVAESFNQGFLALHKGGHGYAVTGSLAGK